MCRIDIFSCCKKKFTKWGYIYCNFCILQTPKILELQTISTEEDIACFRKDLNITKIKSGFQKKIT